MITISKDKSKLDIAVITSFIINSYWGKGRTQKEIETAITNSNCFGVYFEGKQIGFARVLSDGAFFAYIMDVFILPEYRGKGYSKQLMDFMLKDKALKDVKTWMLKTADAHGLYKQFGFTELKSPETVMESIKQ